jgi:sugar/nucleoside kinase (ribokinase family)
MLFANEEEALALSDASEVDAAFEVLAPKFPEVVITRGVQGVIASVGNERAHAPTQAIGVLDTTGAGDAATGAYLGARLNGAGLARSLELAMEASARVVGGLGALG